MRLWCASAPPSHVEEGRDCERASERARAGACWRRWRRVLSAVLCARTRLGLVCCVACYLYSLGGRR